MSPEQRADLQLVRDALAGDPGAVRRLVARLSPVVHARITRVLLAHGRCSSRRNLREEAKDLGQEIFAVLFSRDGKVLRSWSPDLGLSLENFVGMVARRRSISVIRTARRNPWMEDPTDCADFDWLAQGTPPEEARVIARDLLRQTIGAVEDELSDQGRLMMRLIIHEDRSNDEIAEETGLSRDAIYQWRSRLLKALRVRLKAVDGAA